MWWIAPALGRDGGYFIEYRTMHLLSPGDIAQLASSGFTPFSVISTMTRVSCALQAAMVAVIAHTNTAAVFHKRSQNSFSTMSISC
jgi:hypothetical protein